MMAVMQKVFALLLVLSGSIILVGASILFNQPPHRTTPAMDAPTLLNAPKLDIDPTPPLTPEPEPETATPAPTPIPMAIPRASLKLVAVYYLDATAYHRWSDKKPGYKRPYANNKFDDLPYGERWLQEYHYTVAMNLAMDEYNRSRIRLPDGQVTNKYRLHVPGYNTPANYLSDHYTGDLAWLNGTYFSVPRDRMPSQWIGRIDVLFTGDQEHAEQEARIWGNRFLPIEIYEIVVGD